MTPPRARLLVVEDDVTLGLTLETNLGLSGYETVLATTLAAARAELADEATPPPDLIVLDLGLPDGDGLTLCRELRQAGWTLPILILTARGQLDARIRGLREGADDYVAKPFDVPELEARVEALLRRVRWSSEAVERAGEGPSPWLRVGQLEVHFPSYRATASGAPVELTALEFELLAYFTERLGEVVTREDLLADVWGVPRTLKTRTVDVFVSRLRKLIEPEPTQPRHLLSVRGVGYRLVVDPSG